jgi:acetyl-CoA carboxylase, biotin carboxylase subunit
MFKRILVADRGAISLRVIRACHAMGIEAVAVYSEADADAPYLEEADRSVCIGGGRSADSSLSLTAVLQAAEQTECKAIHPGCGFLAESALFAELVQQTSFSWIGPRPRAIRLLGDRTAARRLARAAGLDVIPGSAGAVATPEEASSLGRELGFPVLLKPAAGGSRTGVRLCRDEAAIEDRFRRASLEARRAFGGSDLCVEKLIEGARHLELQFVADSFGNVVHLGERDCSIQRNHRTLIAESPSPAVDQETRRRLGALTCAAVRGVGYVGAGTLELLRDQGGAFHFMGVRPRLQVDHPLTEALTGLDLVQEQIRLAANHPLSFSQPQVALAGSVLGCRINAEDVEAGFRPCPGLVTAFAPPLDAPGARLRVDTHVRPGYRVPAQCDSLMATMVVRADSRAAAITAMLAALAQFKIDGVKTNLAAHARILQHEQFVSGGYDTDLLLRTFG